MAPRDGQDSRADHAAEWIRDTFDADGVRLLLSTLIILSVLPFDWVERYSLVFFGVFAIELAMRLILLRAELRSRSLNRAEIVVLTLDVVATLSFLPLNTLIDTRFLRLVRLSRMLMLLSYWQSVVREIWRIVLTRQRRYQLIFVAALVLILTFCSAIFLAHFSASGIDFNQDGNRSNENFWTMFWWSFRQLQDPGNLLADPAPTMVFIFSVVLTIGGLFVIAFFIGIGASVVEELVQTGHKRRIGVRGHSVIANLGPRAEVLVEELVRYYAKSFRTPRLATMGQTVDRPDFMYRDPLHAVPYRQGQALAEHDLARIDADRATRVILLGDRRGTASDSAIVSQVLSVREYNRDCWIYAELNHQANVGAAVRAGGQRTVPLLAQNFVSMLLADLIVSPGLERVYDQLLTSVGAEVYTCVYETGHLSQFAPPSARLPPFETLLLTGRQRAGVTLLGYLLDDPHQPAGFSHTIAPGPIGDQPAVANVERLRGIVGIARNFEQLKDLCLQLPGMTAQRPTDSEVEEAGALAASIAREPTQRAVERVVVCGYHTGMAELCGQLLLFAPRATIHVIVPDDACADALAATFLELSDVAGRWPGERSLHFEQRQPGSFSCREHGAGDETPAAERPLGHVEIIAGDWSDERVLLERPDRGYRLVEADTVVLTHTEGDADPDARTALALLKLLRFCDEHGQRPDLRLLCAVRSTEKANLFERRFGRGAPAGDGCGCSVTILATDRILHSFVAQGVLVPGLPAIYKELLSKPGCQILQLATPGGADPEAELTFDGLLAALYRQRGVILVAVELAEGADDRCREGRLVVNPARHDPDYRFRATDVRSVFVIGRLAPPAVPG